MITENRRETCQLIDNKDAIIHTSNFTLTHCGIKKFSDQSLPSSGNFFRGDNKFTM